MKTVKDLEKKIKRLKRKDIDKVEHYIDEIENEKKISASGKLTQSWAGALEKFKKDYTSVKLQKKANDWR